MADERPQFVHAPTGAIVFPEGYDQADLQPLPDGYWADQDAAAAIAAVKKDAERQILEIAPIWQQLNDLRAPSPEGDARFAAIDAIREQSNIEEAMVAETIAAVAAGVKKRKS